MWRSFADAFCELQRAYGEGAGSYRPDLHYMRGPGPKWHAKYGNLPPKLTPDRHAKYGNLPPKLTPDRATAVPSLREAVEYPA